jgi:hypothetical protein
VFLGLMHNSYNKHSKGCSPAVRTAGSNPADVGSTPATPAGRSFAPFALNGKDNHAH